MKKLLLICMLAAAIILAGSGAWAYQSFPWASPTDDVYSYQGTTNVPWFGPSTYSGLIIGDSNYLIGGAYTSAAAGQKYLNILTGWGTIPSAPPGNGLSGNKYSEYGAVAADLSIFDSTGKIVAMVGLDNTVQGILYITPATHVTSQDFFKNNTSLIYGGAWNNPISGFYGDQDIPVWTNESGTYINGLVTWLAPGAVGNPSNTFYDVVVNLSDIQTDLSGYTFLYPSATCANSLITGTFGPTYGVPLPATSLLLGSGLLGLLGLRRFRKG